MDRIQVLPGIAIPFYPMRPFRGVSCTTPEAATSVMSMRGTHILHRKLNGDRVIVAKHNGKTYLCNRHGSWYSHGVENKHVFQQLKDGTILDGEVWKKNFYPFDCLAIGGVNITGQSVEQRVEITRNICTTLGVKWMWEVENEWILQLKKNAPIWEGVVAKLRGSTYDILGSDSQENSTWQKRKWVT